MNMDVRRAELIAHYSNAEALTPEFGKAWQMPVAVYATESVIVVGAGLLALAGALQPADWRGAPQAVGQAPPGSDPIQQHRQLQHRVSDAIRTIDEESRSCDPQALDALVAKWKQASQTLSNEVGKLPCDIARLPSLPALLNDYAKALLTALQQAEQCRDEAGVDKPADGLTPAAEVFVWLASLSTFPANHTHEVIDLLKQKGLDLPKAVKHPLFHAPTDLQQVNEHLYSLRIASKF